MVYIGVFVWALTAAFIIVWPNPRIILPFFALTGALLIVFPLRTALFTIVIVILSYDSYTSSVKLFSRNVYLLEFVFVFLIAIFTIEMITGRLKLTVSPTLILFCVFLLSSFLQFYRGIVLGNDLSLVRTSMRSLMFYFLALPVAMFFSGGGSIRKFINITIVGWAAAVAYYLLEYSGIILSTQVSVTGRLVSPPAMNAIGFIPLLILIMLETGNEKPAWEKMAFLFLILASFVVITLTQYRTMVVNLLIEFTLLFILHIRYYSRRKGTTVIKNTFVLLVIGLIGVFVLRGFLSEKTDLVFFNILTRIKSLAMLRQDLALIARFRQVLETIELVKGNWLLGRGLGLEWHSLYFWGWTKIDNVYFNIIGHQGLVGLSIYLSIYALWLQRSIRLLLNKARIEDSVIRAFVFTQPAVIVAMLANGFTSANYYTFPVDFCLLIFWAMTTEHIYRKVLIDPPVKAAEQELKV